MMASTDQENGRNHDSIELQDVRTPEANNSLDNTALPEEENVQSGLKLGLGDFVFYSVLVGRSGI